MLQHTSSVARVDLCSDGVLAPAIFAGIDLHSNGVLALAVSQGLTCEYKSTRATLLVNIASTGNVARVDLGSLH